MYIDNMTNTNVLNTENVYWLGVFSWSEIYHLRLVQQFNVPFLYFFIFSFFDVISASTFWVFMLVAFENV